MIHTMNKTKDIVLGLGEIGNPLLQLMSKKNLVLGYDLNEKDRKSTRLNSSH